MSTPHTPFVVGPFTVGPTPRQGWTSITGVACDTGCQLKLQDGKATFTYCPTHAAAPEMLEMLTKIVNRASRGPVDSTGHEMVAYRKALHEDARTIIARIENGG